MAVVSVSLDAKKRRRSRDVGKSRSFPRMPPSRAGPCTLRGRARRGSCLVLRPRRRRGRRRCRAHRSALPRCASRSGRRRRGRRSAGSAERKQERTPTDARSPAGLRRRPSSPAATVRRPRDGAAAADRGADVVARRPPRRREPVPRGEPLVAVVAGPRDVRAGAARGSRRLPRVAVLPAAPPPTSPRAVDDAARPDRRSAQEKIEAREQFRAEVYAINRLMRRREPSSGRPSSSGCA